MILLCWDHEGCSKGYHQKHWGIGYHHGLTCKANLCLHISWEDEINTDVWIRCFVFHGRIHLHLKLIARKAVPNRRWLKKIQLYHPENWSPKMLLPVLIHLERFLIFIIWWTFDQKTEFQFETPSKCCKSSSQKWTWAWIWKF